VSAPERARSALPGFLRSRQVRLAGGWALLTVGGALLVLPGPGIPLVLGGLALLAPDVRWARRLRQRIRATVRRARGRARAGPIRPERPGPLTERSG
jgi:hypothetical protein